MNKDSGASVWVISRMIAAVSIAVLAGCAGMDGNDMNAGYSPISTPTVDYIETLDVYSAPHKDSFLNQLAMNYRSYAIYNARTSHYSEMGELFAQKAVAAFSGELPFPETLDNWPVEDEQLAFELQNAYNELLDQLKNDASDVNPELAAEAQAKFDCWLSAAASDQTATARECRTRFNRALAALRDCQNGNVSDGAKADTAKNPTPKKSADDEYYPETRTFTSMRGAGHTREGVIIVNNVNVPEHLINPVPVQPMVFNQNIYSGGDGATPAVVNEGPIMPAQNPYVGAGVGAMPPADVDTPVVPNETTPVVTPAQNTIPMIGDELVSREEFINMMMAMRSELQAINARLDQLQAVAATGEKTTIKVQQIPLEPQQHVMEEVLEIWFDFNKATIKPEYKDLIQKLATATQNNKNIKVSVVGHTDTMGSKDYNYSLGGRRAEAVQKLLIKYGIPASQIVTVSAGEEGLKVKTPDQVPNAENRRVRVVKEVYSTTTTPVASTMTEIMESTVSRCGMYGCEQ